MASTNHHGGAFPRKPERDLSTFPPSLKHRRILLGTESFGPVNGVSRTTLMLVSHLRNHGVKVSVVAPHNHTKHNTFLPESITGEKNKSVPRRGKGEANAATTGGVEAAVVSAPAEEALSGMGPATPKLAETGADSDVVRVHGYALPFNPELSVVYPLWLETLYRLTDAGRNATPTAQPPDLIYLASPASLGFQVMLALQQLPEHQRPPCMANFQTDLAGYCAILFPEPLASVAYATFGMVQGYLFRDPTVLTLFYPSRFVRHYLEKLGVPGAKMELLRRGVDVSMFNPLRRSVALRRQMLALDPAPPDHAFPSVETLPSSPPPPDAESDGRLILITVARLAGEKGFEFLARVAHELDVRGLDFVLYVVGGNRNKAVEDEVKGMFAALEARGKVVFAGFRIGAALATCYASADVFLHCSVTETFGLVVLEAMASGVPVVAREEGGPADIVADGVSGYLTPPDDLDAFVERVLRLGRDREGLRRTMSLQAREMAEQATWDKINNLVAWRMADAIAEKEAARMGREIRRVKSTMGEWGGVAELWDAVTEWVTDRLVTPARMWAAFLVVLLFWSAVGPYLIFSEVVLWVKSMGKSGGRKQKPPALKAGGADK